MVGALPFVLKSKYGSSEFYTSGQVKSSASLLGVKSRILPYAIAIACSESEFVEAFPALGEERYLAFRQEIALLFWLEESALNCERLRSKFRNPSGISNSLDMYAGMHTEGSSHHD